MKSHGRSAGFTLLELLLALGIMMVVMGALVALFGSSLQLYTSQRQLSDVNQNAEIAAAMLQFDLKTAGFTGGADEAAVNTANSGATAYSPDYYLAAASYWPFTGPSPSSSFFNTLTLGPSSASCNTICDSLSLVRVVKPIGLPANRYRIEKIDYTASADMTTGLYNMTRQSTFYSCAVPPPAYPPGTVASANTSATTTCSTTSGGTTVQPAVEGVEEFQVFVQYKDGTFHTDVAIPPTPRLTANPVSAVFVYIRLRAPKVDSRVKDTTTYPTSALKLPTGYTFAQLGIPSSVSYINTAPNYRRVEKLIGVTFANNQVTPTP